MPVDPLPRPDPGARTLKRVVIYTDGACTGNPGRGGYGAVLLHGEKRRELSGGYRLTTNNRMELMAVIAGLESLRYACAVTVYSDSQYVVNGITKGWAARWRARGWMRTPTEPAVNADLWARLLDLCARHQVRFQWVRGHAGDAENECCDRLSVAAASRSGLLEDVGYASPPKTSSPAVPAAVPRVGPGLPVPCGAPASRAAGIALLVQESADGNSYYGPSVVRALKGVSASEAASRVTPGAPSIWQITAHITAEIEYAIRVVAGTAERYTDDSTWPAVTDTSDAAWHKAVHNLRRAGRELSEAIAALDDAALDAKPVRVSGPLWRSLLGVVGHNAYHAGQIDVLRRTGPCPPGAAARHPSQTV